jgi:hypothetical protein
MQTDNLVTVNDFCIHHNIDISFINSLKQYGLIEITTVKETEFIDTGHLQQLEMMVRFHYEMEINLEGIETITHLLHQMNAMQHEITELGNKLRLYESTD